MAHSLSAQKRIRQNVKHRARNRWRKDRLHQAVKGYIASIDTGRAEESKKQLPDLCKLIDQVAAKGTIHRNAASRYKSRLTARLNRALAKKAA